MFVLPFLAPPFSPPPTTVNLLSCLTLPSSCLVSLTLSLRLFNSSLCLYLSSPSSMCLPPHLA